ncbi:MAG: hypothetical protein RLZZ214_3552 [Verrucomicrobiota bacterium]|jgi:hypothetical protein
MIQCFKRITIMKNRLSQSFTSITVAGLIATAPANATDCFNSEASHFAGGAALASATSAALFKFCPKVKHPALTGFAVAVAGALLGEIPLYSDAHFSALDVVSGSLGGAIGALATDRWYIAPRIESRKEETIYAVTVAHQF